ncbi:alpha/beta hydrolase fold [Muriicola jejuensis]|uniref:Alpha/beta fold hydrolase n=1 Tax=Muriicola jejuensis TaxID=504488 RepID=A0A6P0UJQ0_9FLAO|nr:alpha/beta hydrolase [Muriicola jejuensis]NER10436.1 alpha/beta fold hydrolase [Muriicola jejuensis]SMP00808.1 alpha/beta hydrolase fold [Muriicola jejuensis]
MKNLIYILCFLSFIKVNAQDAVLDTLVDIGGYKMHFSILKGNDNVILFESGAGDDGSVWEGMGLTVHEITGATVISYDRSGFGKSELNPNHKKDDQFGILNGVIELELALEKIGYFDNLILVSHSYGGFYTTLFSSRNPDKVLFNVRVDANLANQYTEEILVKAEQDNSVHQLKDIHLGQYYLGINFANTVRLMWNTEYPSSIPAIDLVSPIQRHHTDKEWELLLQTHQDFVDTQTNRTGIIANGSGHYIFLDNPGLVINAIVKAYCLTLSDSIEVAGILERALNNSMEQLISLKSEEYNSRITDTYSIRQGYALMKNDELSKAEKVLQLSTELYPNSSSAYEYYGKVLLLLERKQDAIEALEKSIELDPKNVSAQRELRRIKNE